MGIFELRGLKWTDFSLTILLESIECDRFERIFLKHGKQTLPLDLLIFKDRFLDDIFRFDFIIIVIC